MSQECTASERGIELTNEGLERSLAVHSAPHSPQLDPSLATVSTENHGYSHAAFAPQNGNSDNSGQYPPYYASSASHAYTAPHREPEAPRYEEAPVYPSGASAVEIYQQRWEESQRQLYEQEQQQLQQRQQYRDPYYQERQEQHQAGSSGSVSPNDDPQHPSGAHRAAPESYFYMAQSNSSHGPDVFERSEPSPTLPVFYNYSANAQQGYSQQESYAQYGQYTYGPPQTQHGLPYPSNNASRSGSLSDASSSTPRTKRDAVNTDDRPFQCDVCPHSFHRNHDLKRHKRIHLEIKPYPCDWCEKRFTRKDALKRHLLVKQHPITAEDEAREQKKAEIKANNKKLKGKASLRGVGQQTAAAMRKEAAKMAAGYEGQSNSPEPSVPLEGFQVQSNVDVHPAMHQFEHATSELLDTRRGSVAETTQLMENNARFDEAARNIQAQFAVGFA